MNKVNLFISGNPKCGTSSLAYYLNQHPDISLGKLKEPNYFNRLQTKDFNSDIENYHELFSWNAPFQLDATPLYLSSTDAINSILRYNKEAKIMAVLRHPVEAMYSGFLHNSYSFVEHEVSFYDALDAQDKRAKWTHIEGSSEPVIRLQYFKLYAYSLHLRHLISKLGSTQIKVIDFEKLKANPSKVCASIFSWIQVDDTSEEINYKVVNTAKAHKSTWIGNKLKNPPKFVSKTAKALLKPEQRSSIYQFIQNRNKTKPLKENLDEAHERLIPFVETQVKELKELGFDFSHWLKTSSPSKLKVE